MHLCDHSKGKSAEFLRYGTELRKTKNTNTRPNLQYKKLPDTFSHELILTKLPWLRQMLSFVQILHRKQHCSGQKWAQMFLYDGVWSRTNQKRFLPQTQTHSWLFWRWMEICECLSNVLVSLCFFLVDKYQSFPKDAVRRYPGVKQT